MLPAKSFSLHWEPICSFLKVSIWVCLFAVATLLGIDCILVSFMNQTKSFEITNVFREISIKWIKGQNQEYHLFSVKGGGRKQNGTGSMIKIRSVISPPILHPEREHLNCLCPVMHYSHLSLLSAMRGGSRLGFSMDSICGQRRK